VFYLDFAEGELTEDIEYLVYYKPILVPYGVRYFFQNINDDLYTEKAEYYHTHEALTGTIIDNKDFDDCTAITKDTTGFELMYHIPDSVAADGSTVFELYYDRNYYLIQFDFAGGYGSDPIYARYGTPFVVNTPVKHGYVFKGWDLNGDGVEDPMPDTIPAENRKYTALWETADTKYTVVYWKENADDNGYSYWGKAEKDAVSATKVSGSDDIPASVTTTVVNGSNVNERKYFKYNDTLTDKNVVVKGDGSTVVNVYYDRNTYTVVFTGNLTLTNQIAGHVHSDACKEYICNTGHVHTAECKVTCGETEHTHVADCYSCKKTEHVHSSECCMLEEHSHQKSCWNYSGIANSPTSLYYAPDDAENGQIYYSNSYRRYYICLYNEWYRYSDYSGSSNAVIKPNCGKNEHTHGNGCTYCKDNLEEHTHGAECSLTNCSNGGNEHTHSSSCYNCGEDGHVHTDACLGYCSMPEYGTSNIPGDFENKKYYITAKYEQTIGDIWPTADYFTNSNFYGWSIEDITDSTAVSKRINMTADLCDTGDGIKEAKSASSNTASTKYLYYMFESFDQTSPANGNERKLRNGVYYDSDPIYYQKVRSSGNFNQKEILGMIPVNNGVTESNNNIFLYYKRNRVELTFKNIATDVKTLTNIMYGQPFAEYSSEGTLLRDYVPPYPTTLEPNAYEFAGWYTTPECFDGTKVDWDKFTMPNSDYVLYAKWAPVDHEVLFFEDLDAMNAYIGGDTSVDVFEKHIVKHGEVIGPVEGPEERWENPEDTGNDDKKLVFSGWYYIESGEKKAFTPADFPIKKDMKIFADWGGTTHTPFKISYITYDENGEKVKIADDYTGFAIVGTTKTFNAKAGSPLNQLYPKYNDDAYFPLVASHSITMQYDSAKYAQDATVNVYEFEYVKAEIPIDYKVQYIDKETGLSLLPDAEKNTTKAVITERFRAINGYIPDAFYKRLVISVEYDEETKKFVGNDEENVLIFYYTPNTTSAYYAVHFMLEKLDATDETRQQYNIDGTGGYEESGTHIEGIGDVNSTVEIIPQTFPGFTLIGNKGIEVDDLDADGVIESGETTTDKTLNTDGEYEIKITQNGTELYIFYSRNSYPYSVYYYLYNTKDPVPNGTDSNGDTTYQLHKTNIMAKYGSEVTEEAVKIPGYTCVSATEQSLLIREETAQNKNEIIFYYSPTKYTVEYKAVPPEGGTLSATIEVITGQKDFTGSVPTANPGWKFEGWYINEECTVAVCDSNGTVENGTNKFVPLKSGLSETESNIFYAKFVPDVAPLTIVRKNPCDTDQAYVYKISWQNEDDQTESITVTISDFVKDENDEWVGSVTVQNLTLGKEYTVTQINDWSWRNNDSPIEITHEGNPNAEGILQGTTVTFSETETKPKWLNGLSSLVKNIFTIIAGD